MKMTIQKGHIHVVPRLRAHGLESTQSQNKSSVSPRNPWLSSTKHMAFHPETPMIQPLAYICEGMKQYRQMAEDIYVKLKISIIVIMQIQHETHKSDLSAAVFPALSFAM